MVKYGLLMDTKRCMGCRSCVAACMIENFYQPGNPWLFVVENEVGKYPYVSRTFVPMNCMHCENPPCKTACDNVGANAISKNDNGVVLIDYEKCIGCRYCIAVCPYGAPHYISDLNALYPEGTTRYESIATNNRHPVHRKKEKTAEKCTLCWHKLEKALSEGMEPGEDQESTPSCVVVCPVRARYFGDLDDPMSEISQLIAQKRATQLKTDFGTNPQVYYILEGGGS